MVANLVICSANLRMFTTLVKYAEIHHIATPKSTHVCNTYSGHVALPATHTYIRSHPREYIPVPKVDGHHAMAQACEYSTKGERQPWLQPPLG